MLRMTIGTGQGESDWQGNVRKCLDANIDTVIVAPTRPDVRSSILASAERLGVPDSVQIVTPAEVWRRLRGMPSPRPHRESS